MYRNPRFKTLYCNVQTLGLLWTVKVRFHAHKIPTMGQSKNKNKKIQHYPLSIKSPLPFTIVLGFLFRWQTFTVMAALVCVLNCFLFLHETYRWNHRIFDFLHINYIILHKLKTFYFATNVKISFFKQLRKFYSVHICVTFHCQLLMST